MELAGPAIYHMGPYGRWASRPVFSLSLRFPTSLSVSLSALISLSLSAGDVLELELGLVPHRVKGPRGNGTHERR
jgi:hypothetical protein